MADLFGPMIKYGGGDDKAQAALKEISGVAFEKEEMERKLLGVERTFLEVEKAMQAEQADGMRGTIRSMRDAIEQQRKQVLDFIVKATEQLSKLPKI